MRAGRVVVSAAAARARLREGVAGGSGGSSSCGHVCAAARVPAATPTNLRLATWNIRELRKKTRLAESIDMIAEIVRAFDFVSVVELRDDTGDLERVLAALGPTWDALYSDYRLDAGGNLERVGFVVDRAQRGINARFEPGTKSPRRSSGRTACSPGCGGSTSGSTAPSPFGEEAAYH